MSLLDRIAALEAAGLLDRVPTLARLVSEIDRAERLQLDVQRRDEARATASVARVTGQREPAEGLVGLFCYQPGGFAYEFVIEGQRTRVGAPVGLSFLPEAAVDALTSDPSARVLRFWSERALLVLRGDLADLGASIAHAVDDPRGDSSGTGYSPTRVPPEEIAETTIKHAGRVMLERWHAHEVRSSASGATMRAESLALQLRRRFGVDAPRPTGPKGPSLAEQLRAGQAEAAE